MDAALERRDPDKIRVPLDDVMVEIAPEGFDETFEADAINVGSGGLSMRSAILPDVGARLRCRFESPHDGSAVDADCEVVWAADAGPNLGEFGLKFTGMTGDDATSIAALVDAWNEALDDCDSPAPTGGRVTLHLQGVGQPVDAEMIHRATDALLVEQALPFLKVGTGVEEGGRSGRLEAVDLRMEGNTPKLILTIGYAATDPSGVIAFDAEQEDEADTTLMDAPVPARALDGFDAIDDSDDAVDELFDDDDDVDDEDHEMRADNPRSVPELVRYDPESESEPELQGDEADALAAMRPSAKQRFENAQKQAKVYWSKTRVAMVALWARLAPTARSWWARAKHFGGSMVRRTGPWLADLKKRVARKSESARSKRATRAPKRRTTAPKSRDAAPRRRFKLRWWLVVAAAGIGIAVVGRADTAIVPSGDKLPKPVVEPELGDVGAEIETLEEASEHEAEATSDAIEPQAPPVLEIGDVEPETPRALPEARRSAGRIPEPSFPSLGEAARPAAPGTVPSESPYSVDVRESAARSFGEASISGGQEFRIRLSADARGLHGETTDDGFTVVVVGARAEEGARRIASVHPGVERASIDNQGNQATLTLKFVAGRSPAYRVHVRGSALYVTLGQ